MSERQTLTTEHGEVSYEVVECDSCGNTIAKSDATDFIVGDVTDVTTFSTMPDKYKFGNGMHRGYVCPYCKDDPARFPEGGLKKKLASTKAYFTAIALLCCLLTVLAIMVVAL